MYSHTRACVTSFVFITQDPIHEFTIVNICNLYVYSRACTFPGTRKTFPAAAQASPRLASTTDASRARTHRGSRARVLPLSLSLAPSRLESPFRRHSTTKDGENAAAAIVDRAGRRAFGRALDPGRGLSARVWTRQDGGGVARASVNCARTEIWWRRATRRVKGR